MKGIKVSDSFSGRLLFWLTQNQTTYCYLNSNSILYPDMYRQFDEVFAVGAASVHQPSSKKFDALQRAVSEGKWLFGFLGYDLKNELEELQSQNRDALGLPELLFIEPEIVISKKGNEITFLKGEKQANQIIEHLPKKVSAPSSTPNLEFNPSLQKQEYLKKIQGLKQHIQRGNIYEVNFCQEYLARVSNLDVFATYQALNKLSPVPFSGLFQHQNLVHFSASPERFIQKQGNRIISQPIKGTRKRGKNKQADNILLKELQTSLKDKTENVMIVDLVRNDLSRTAARGSVKVVELCKIYAFPQVYQMISTIASEVKEGIHPIEVIKKAFPMGSMTGAPKISAMQLIEEYENFKRGWYSGALGYITPNGDFDFNVVIRSLTYQKTKQLLQYAVGGAITALSDPEEEYEECLTKASALQQLFSTNKST